MSLTFVLAALFIMPQETLPSEIVTMNTSYYGGTDGLNGQKMANGERFDENDQTVAAHKSLPLGTQIKLTNPQNGKSQLVEVKDRGPYEPGRQLDVSEAAAERLGFKEQGVTKLKAEIFDSNSNLKR